MSDAERALTLPPRWSQANATWREALQTLVIGGRRDRFGLAGLIIYLVFFVRAGVPRGPAAAYDGAWAAPLLMRAADVASGIPFLPMAIVLVAFLGPSIWNVLLVMTLLLWRDTGRIIRAQVLSLRTRWYGG